MQSYNCREKGDTRWKPVEESDPEEAALSYAQDRGYDDVVIEVEGHGFYRVTSRTEWFTEKLVE